MRRLLLLGGPIFQVPIIRKAKEMGVHVGVIDINTNAPAAMEADEFFVGSIKDYDGCLKICSLFKPDGIMSGACDTSVVTVARLCEKLNLPGNNLETAMLSTDKLLMINRFKKMGVAHPEFLVVTKADINRNTIPKFELFPAICKPTDSSGSRGICYISNEKEYEKCIRESLAFSSNGSVLVEEYMEGPEVSVEVIVVDNIPYILQITDKITSGAPHFFETGHSQPSALDENTKQSISELASKAVLSLGINNSPAHVEIKITKDGPKMVELGARMGGGTITTYLIDNSIKGINMSQAAIKLALGIPLGPILFRNSGVCSAVKFILAKNGVLQSVENEEYVRAQNDIVNVTITGKPGKDYSITSDNASRIGFVVAKANSTKNALSICEQAIQKLKITYKNEK